MLDLTHEQRMLVADERGFASKRHCQPQDSAFVFLFIGLVDHERFSSVCIRKGKQGRSNIRFVVKRVKREARRGRSLSWLSTHPCSCGGLG